MSPRPRTVADAEIIAAVCRTMSKLGPVKLTLADVGKDVGLSPATLLQRFGSKRGLLLAVAEQAVGGVDDCFASVRAANPSPLAALIAAATEMSRCVTTPEELANSLAFLQINMSDPDFHRLALANSHGILAGYRKLLDEAVAAGELVPCDTSQLARTVGALSGGSLIAWAIHREGSAETWVREDLDALLNPYRPQASVGEGRPLGTPREARGRERGRSLTTDRRGRGSTRQLARPRKR